MPNYFVSCLIVLSIVFDSNYDSHRECTKRVVRQTCGYEAAAVAEEIVVVSGGDIVKTSCEEYYFDSPTCRLLLPSSSSSSRLTSSSSFLTVSSVKGCPFAQLPSFALILVLNLLFFFVSNHYFSSCFSTWTYDTTTEVKPSSSFMSSHPRLPRSTSLPSSSVVFCLEPPLPLPLHTNLVQGLSLERKKVCLPRDTKRREEEEEEV